MMLEIKKINEVKMSDVVEAFNAGFSDYVIQHTWSEGEFTARFFGPEGNQEEHSLVAYMEGKPVAVMLGGIRNYDGMKTLRCGAMCMVPAYRGSGLAQQLFEQHKDIAKREGCRQLFLEVIRGNDRAIRFYEKSGYEAIYNLRYYRHELAEIKNNPRYARAGQGMEFGRIGLGDLMAFRNGLRDCHVSWQCEPVSFENDNSSIQMTAVIKGEQVGVAAMSATGKVYFLWVAPEHRHQGIGTALVTELGKIRNVDKISFSTTNSSTAEGFLKSIGCQRETVEQYEMYRVL